MRKIFIALTAILLLISCMNNTNDNSWEKSMTGVFRTSCTDDPSIEPFTSDGTVSVHMDFNRYNTVQMILSGVKFSPMMPAINFALQNVTYTVGEDDDTWTFNAKNLVPYVGGVPREDYTLQQFKGQMTSNTMSLDFSIETHEKTYNVRFTHDKAEEE